MPKGQYPRRKEPKLKPRFIHFKSDTQSKDELAEIFADRMEKYGEFAEEALTSQSLKTSMYLSKNWHILSNIQKEALEMIQHKISRILNGDPSYADSWVDLAGYSKLVSDRLKKMQKEQN